MQRLAIPPLRSELLMLVVALLATACGCHAPSSGNQPDYVLVPRYAPPAFMGKAEVRIAVHSVPELTALLGLSPGEAVDVRSGISSARARIAQVPRAEAGSALRAEELALRARLRERWGRDTQVDHLYLGALLGSEADLQSIGISHMGRVHFSLPCDSD